MTQEKLKVCDLMTTNVVTIGMDDTLKSARSIFDRRKFHHLLVIEDGKVVGVLSDRDLLKNLSPFLGSPFSQRPQDAATLQKKAHQMMSRKLVSIGPDETISLAAERMMHERVSCLPVVDHDDKPLGIITIHDLLGWFVDGNLTKTDFA